MQCFKSVGLLSDLKPITIDNWASLARKSLESRLAMNIPSDGASVISALRDVIPSSDRVCLTLEALDWLTKAGQHASTSGLQLDVPKKPMLPIDLFSTLLAHRLRYE